MSYMLSSRVFADAQPGQPLEILTFRGSVRAYVRDPQLAHMHGPTPKMLPDGCTLILSRYT